MKKNLVKIIIAVVVVVILLIPIISEMKQNSGISSIKYEKFADTVTDTSSYKFALIYVAPKSMQNVNDKKDEIKKVLKKYTKDDQDLKSYYIDADEIDANAIQELGVDTTTGQAYIFATNGEVIKTISGDLDSKKLEAYVKEFTSNGISKDLVSYKVAENASVYLKSVDAKKTVTMAVFGRDNCYYCQQFLPVVNTVAEENKLENVYYFDSNNYNEDEYDKIMKSDLYIPAECSTDGNKAKLSDGFGTPLTLFTKNGKVIDCISGYVNKESLISKLETVGMIVNEE